jgi:uncharacterized protein (TIGR02444 family)
MTVRLELDGAHWRFALALYGQGGAADACLALQDRLGVDVNILLFAIFAVTERGMAVAPQDIRGMDAVVKTWREATVAPLRTMRRQLKQPLGPAGSEHAEVLRAEIKKAELLAEQIEQALLARWLDQRRGEPRPRLKSPDLPDLLRTVVAHFAEATGAMADTEAAEVRDAISCLVSAVARVRRGEDSALS